MEAIEPQQQRVSLFLFSPHIVQPPMHVFAFSFFSSRSMGQLEFLVFLQLQVRSRNQEEDPTVRQPGPDQRRSRMRGGPGPEEGLQQRVPSRGREVELVGVMVGTRNLRGFFFVKINGTHFSGLPAALTASSSGEGAAPTLLQRTGADTALERISPPKTAQGECANVSTLD